MRPMGQGGASCGGSCVGALGRLAVPSLGPDESGNAIEPPQTVSPTPKH